MGSMRGRKERVGKDTIVFGYCTYKAHSEHGEDVDLPKETMFALDRGLTWALTCGCEKD